MCLTMKLDIQIDTKSVERELQGLSRDIKEKALSSALNKTATQARTAAARRVKAIYQVSTRAVRNSIRIQRSNYRTLTATLIVDGKPFPVMAFSAKQNKSGVSFRLKGRRVMIPHAFIATMSSGHKGVFARGGYPKSVGVINTGETWGGKFKFGVNRTPINELKTISVPYAFLNNSVQTELRYQISEIFPKIFWHEIDWRMSKL